MRYLYFILRAPTYNIYTVCPLLRADSLPGFLCQEDSDFVLRCLKLNGLALQHVAKKLQRRRPLVLAAVRQNGLALQYAHPSLRADAEARE